MYAEFHASAERANFFRKRFTALVESGVHVLSETPPAPDLDGLRKLWVQVGGRDLVQVAEQYLLMPGHAARRELVTRRTFSIL